MKINSIQIPLSPEVEQLVAHLSESEKKTLSLIISAFVARPNRSMPQVMEDMSRYSKKQGLRDEDFDGLLK
jgi:hypothetical protein